MVFCRDENPTPDFSHMEMVRYTWLFAPYWLEKWMGKSFSVACNKASLVIAFSWANKGLRQAINRSLG